MKDKQLYRVRLLPNNSVPANLQTLGYLSKNNRIGVYGKPRAIQLAYEHHGIVESNEQEIGTHKNVGFFSVKFPNNEFQMEFFAPLPAGTNLVGGEYTYRDLGFSKKQFFEHVLFTDPNPKVKHCILEKILPFEKAVIDYNEQETSTIRKLYDLAEEMGVMLESKYWTENFRENFNKVMAEAENKLNEK